MAEQQWWEVHPNISLVHERVIVENEGEPEDDEWLKSYHEVDGLMQTGAPVTGDVLLAVDSLLYLSRLAELGWPSEDDVCGRCGSFTVHEG